MIGFGTDNLDMNSPSRFWRHILLDGEYDLVMASGDKVIGPEIVVMADQAKAADIAALAKDITVYEKRKAGWIRR